jgi:hypothetical protein
MTRNRIEDTDRPPDEERADLQDLEPGEESEEEVRGGATRRPEPQPPSSPGGPVPTPYPNSG